MSALREYEQLRNEPVGGDWKDAAAYENGFHFAYKHADAAIESLKCCGNCDNYGDWAEDSPCTEDIRRVWDALPNHALPDKFDSHDSCHFTPSRWQEREP